MMRTARARSSPIWLIEEGAIDNLWQARREFKMGRMARETEELEA